jgi:hypothetical protein
LNLAPVNLVVVAGFGLIVAGLLVLLIGLGWSAGRRLRNLADDPPAVRGMIVAGLILAAIGVVLGAVAARAS